MIRRLFIVALFLFFRASPGLGATLDLESAERLALQRNLDLRALEFEARAGDALVRKGYGIYDPQVQLTVAEGEGRERTNLIFISETEANIVKYRDLNLSVSQLLPLGARLSAFFTNLREDSNSTSRLFNPSYQAELGLSLVQPLLRDFGRTVTESPILLATRDRSIAFQDLRQEAFDLVRDVRHLYYEALSLRDQMAYRESSVALAERVLEENRARLDAGVLPAVEVLEAEVGLQLRQRELLDARRLYEDALDRFGVLLNTESPTDLAEPPPVAADVVVDDGIAFDHAREKRPDLLRQVEEIERRRIECEVARNRLLPALDLGATYSHKGLGQNVDDAFDDIGSNDFRNWEVAFNFSYPIGNREARNEYRRIELLLKNLHARLAQLCRQTRREIRSARRFVEVSRKKVEVTEKGRELAREQLRTLLGRLSVGLATTRDVLEGEEDLARARTDQIAARAEYGQSITNYLWVTGTLLAQRGVDIAEPDAEDDSSLFSMEKK